jgi:biopolymer transport protein TolR
VRVVVRSDGRVSIVEQGKAEIPVPTGRLVATVKQRRKAETTPVVIEGDAKVPYKAIADALSELQKAGIERVGLSVQLAQ